MDSIRNLPEEQPVLRNYSEELAKIIRSGISPRALKDRLSDYHQRDIAEVLEELTPAERKKLYGILDSDELSGVFEFVDHPYVYIDELNIRKKVDILSCMDPDKAIACLREMPREQREMLIDLMDEGSRRDIAMVDAFDEDEVGSIMTTNYIVIQRGSTIKGAMADLISQAAENDNISTIYVTEKDAYYGAIDLKDLIISRENSNLEDIIATSYPYLYAREQIEDCLERIKDYSEDSIPVLSSDNRLLGVVTSQSIVQVVDEELGDDYAKLGGLTAEEDLNEPTIQSIRKRLPWLLILMVLGMVVSGVVGLFEGIMAQLTIIVSFPVPHTGHGGQRGHSVPCGYYPRTYGWNADRQAEAGAGVQGGPYRPVKRTDTRGGIMRRGRALHNALQGQDGGLRLRHIRLHRRGAAACDGGIQHSGDLRASALQKAGCGSRRGFRPADNNSERPHRSSGLLRPCVAAADKHLRFWGVIKGRI